MKSDCGGCELGGKCESGKLTRKQFLLGVASVFLLTLVLVFAKLSWTQAHNELKCFTREEVKTAVDEQKKCLTIYDGGVYDFTKAKKWDLTGHLKQHACGNEYTKEEIENGPHRVEKVMPMFLVGKIDCEVGGIVKESDEISASGLFGMSWFRISAYLSLLFFLLNFLTCYAMPWATWKEPWKGDFPGKDKKDVVGKFTMTHWHKHWAYLAVMTLLWHGVLGFLRVFFGLYI